MAKKHSDGTIDISDLPDEEYREKIRRLSDLYSSPCLYCQARCYDWHECDEYSEWYSWMNEGVQIRKRRGKKNNG